MRRNNPIYLDKYTHDNDLIKKPGQKQLHSYVKNTKDTNRLLKAAKAKQKRNTSNIKFGVNILLDHKEEMLFDADNGNTNCKDDDILEL